METPLPGLTSRPPTPSPLSYPLARWEHLLLALGGHRVSCVPREGRQRVPWEEPGTSRLRLARWTGRARSPYRLCVSTGWTPCRERVHTTHTAGPRGLASAYPWQALAGLQHGWVR